MGDWVEVKETGEGEGMVWEIEPRRSAFDRPAARMTQKPRRVLSRRGFLDVLYFLSKTDRAFLLEPGLFVWKITCKIRRNPG